MLALESNSAHRRLYNAATPIPIPAIYGCCHHTTQDRVRHTRGGLQSLKCLLSGPLKVCQSPHFSSLKYHRPKSS